MPKNIMNAATSEIERKFLVGHIPHEIASHRHEEIVQGYLAIVDDGPEVRIRRKGGRCYQTVKSVGKLARAEWEIELTMQQFQALWPATEGRRIEKTRYDYFHNGVKVEIDVYRGRLSGLVTAEVEFVSETESNQFEPMDWFGKDVTCDERYKNRNLAIHGLPS